MGLDALRDLIAGVSRFPAHYIPIIRDALKREARGSGVMFSEEETLICPPSLTVAAAAGAFVVKVEKDGGDAGSAASGTIPAVNCSFTYTVTALDDTELGTLVSPEQSRYPGTIYLEAGTGGRSEYALAGYDEDDNLLLMTVDEIADTSVCP